MQKRLGSSLEEARARAKALVCSTSLSELTSAEQSLSRQGFDGGLDRQTGTWVAGSHASGIVAHCQRPALTEEDKEALIEKAGAISFQTFLQQRRAMTGAR